MSLRNRVRCIIDWLNRGKNKAAEDKTALRQRYFEAGLQYHITARYAAFSWFTPVCGNLFHHSIEMYLKGYLCRSMDEKQRRQLGHHLKKIWKKFKQDVSDPKVSAFDSVISTLDKHEEIRYPEKIVRNGMTALIDFTRIATTPVATPPQTRPKYTLYVDEVDALSKVIFEKSKMNPKFLTNGLNPYAREFLNRDNKSPLS